MGDKVEDSVDIGDDISSMIDALNGVSEDGVSDEEIIDDENIDEDVNADDEIISDDNIDNNVSDEPNKDIEDLKARIETLSTQLNEANKTNKPDVKPPEPELLKFDQIDFIGDNDPYEVISNKESLNNILNQVYAKGVNESKNLASEGVLRAIPDIVKNNIETISTLQKASDKFYNDNKDLAPFKAVVGTVFEEVASKNPGKGLEVILADVGKEVRVRLKLKDNVIKNDVNNGKPPRLPNKGKRPKAPVNKTQMSDLESDIAKMNEALGGN